MKRLTYISSLLCAVALAGCSNDDFVAESGTVALPSGDVTLVATTGADTRTTVDGLQIKWGENDKFYAYGSKTDYVVSGELAYQSSSDNVTATFSGTLTNDGTTADLTNALYALSGYETKESIPSSVTFPTSYTYPDSNAPMFGTKQEDGTMKFDQILCGMLRLKMSNVTSVTSGTLVLKANGDNPAKITGKGTLSITDAGVATLAAPTEGTSEVTLSFGSEAVKEGTIILDIPVPAADATNGTTYASGFHVALTIDGSVAEFDTKTNLTMKAGQLVTMKALNVVSMTGKTIEFTEQATDANAANQLMKANATNVEITSVSNNDEIQVPANGNTYTLSMANTGDNINITVTGVPVEEEATPVAQSAARKVLTRAEENTNSSIAAKVILKGLTGNKVKVTLKNIKEIELGGAWAEAKVDAGCTSVAITEKAAVDKVTIASDNVQEITVAGDATTTEISMAEGTTNTNLKATVATADAFKSALALSNDITLGGDITIPAGKDSIAISNAKVIDLNGYTITLNTDVTEGGRTIFVVKAATGEGGTETANLTIKDTSTDKKGTITNVTTSTATDAGKGLIRVYDGTLTLQDITLIDDLEHYDKYTSDGLIDAAIVYSGASTVSVENCKITSGVTAIWGTKENNSSNVTMKNCICDGYASNAKNNYVYCVFLRGKSGTLENCTVSGIQGAVCAYAETVTIKGGTYYTHNQYSANDAWHALYVTNGSKVTIEDGNFYAPNVWHSMGDAIGGTSCVYASDDDKGITIGDIISIQGGKYSGKPYRLLESDNTQREVYTLSEGYEWKAIDETVDGRTYKWEVVKKTTE